MTVRTPTYLKARFENNDVPQQADYGDIFDSFLPISATGKQTLDISLNISGDFTASGVINGNDIIAASGSFGSMVIGDPGNEGSGINIGGTTYDSTFKVSDINGTKYAQTILHRHSTTLEPLVVGARSNSNTSAHSTVTSGQNMFSIYGAGYAGTNYKLFGAISIASDTNGAISDSASPGKIIFSVTKKSSTTPTAALTLDSNGDTTIGGNITVSAVQQSVNSSVAATGTTTAAAKSLNEAISYVKVSTSGSNEALIIGKCRPGFTQIIINDASASAALFPTSASRFNQLANGAAYQIPDRTTLTVYHITSAQYFTSRTSR